MRNVKEKIFQNSIFFIAVGVMAVIVMSHQTNHAVAPVTTADAKIGPIWRPLSVNTPVPIRVGEFARQVRDDATSVIVLPAGTLGGVVNNAQSDADVGNLLIDADVQNGSFTIEGEPSRRIKLTFVVTDIHKSGGAGTEDGISFTLRNLDLAGTGTGTGSGATDHGALRAANSGAAANSLVLTVADTQSLDVWLDLSMKEQTTVSFGGLFALTSIAIYPKVLKNVATIQLTVQYSGS